MGFMEKIRIDGLHWNLKDRRYWLIYGVGSLVIGNIFWRVMT